MRQPWRVPSEREQKLPVDAEPPIELEVAPGDLLVSRANTRQLLGSAALVTPSSARLVQCDKLYRIATRTDVLDQRYLARAFASAWVRHQLERDATGTSDSMQNTIQQSIRELELPIPPPKDQLLIADFLDRETERIDALVAKKQRLIELLQEKRTALISHAVTKGLDPDVPMKDSGIEWLGAIPAHWDAGPLRRFWDVVDCKHLTVSFHGEGVPVASIGEVKGTAVDLTDAKLTTREEASQLSEGGRKPGRGDVIISRNATVGEAALVETDSDFCLGQDVSLIRSAENDQRYLVYLLQSPSIRRQIEAEMIGATFRRINVGCIKDLQVLRPEVQEQLAIGRFCDGVLRAYSDAVARMIAAIDRLREYRSALITAAVTGQIDVNSRQARRQAEGL